MEYVPYNTSTVTRSRWVEFLARHQSSILLALWTICAAIAFVDALIDAQQSWSILALLGTMPLLVALWFWLQWELVHYYVPALPLEKWHTHSGAGFAGGLVAGGITGVVGAIVAISLPTGLVSVQTSTRLVLLAGAAGLAVGFAVLGWQQAWALKPYLQSVWWWVGTMAIAWVPVLLAWLGYDAILGGLVVNIYPDPHTIVKVLAGEVALLCPGLVVFALIVRRARTTYAIGAPNVQQPDKRSERPIGTLVGLLLPPLAVIAAFGWLLIGQAFRVERA